MVFGNAANVERIRAEVPQATIYAMRLPRAVMLADIARRARLSTDEVRRYNPALTARVPAGATLYLPSHVAEFGLDVAFWHRPPGRAYAELLDRFVRLDVTLDEWNSASFDGVLEDFRTGFAATKSEEGTVMATALGYAMQDRRGSRQAVILADFRTNERILRLFRQAQLQREVFRAANAAAQTTTN
jgi:hypothetical protein